MPLLSVIAGSDEPGAAAATLGRVEDVAITDVTVFVTKDGPTRASEVMRNAVSRAARVLEARGARIAEVSLQRLSQSFWIWAAMMDDAGSESYAELVSGSRELSVLRELFRVARRRSNHTLPVLAIVAAQKLLERLPKGGLASRVQMGHALGAELDSLLGDRGVLLMPPYSRPAPRHMEPLLTPFDAGFTAVFNVLQMPATQVPTGFDSRGLPVGVQVIGRRGNDHLTIAVAAAIEQTFGRLGRARPELHGKRAPAVHTKQAATV